MRKGKVFVPSRKIFSISTLKTIVILLIGFFAGTFSLAGVAKQDLQAETPLAQQTIREDVTKTKRQGKAEVIALTKQVIPEGTKKPDEVFAVVSVTDGDTIKVNINGKTETLRLIGIDTPETVDPRKTVQCFGKEASTKAKEMLTGKKVRLEGDTTQGERDKYQRLLRYVYLEDGTFFNKWMIENGFAHEYTYNQPYKFQSEFKEAEKTARENRRGLWGDICNGDTTQPAAKTKNRIISEPEALEILADMKLEAFVDRTISERTNGVGEGFTCNCAKTCAAMDCAEAQYQLNACGCSRRDRDMDGIACDADCA